MIAERILVAVVTLAALVLVGSVVLALLEPEPVPAQPPAGQVACGEADGACLTWDQIRESEWRSD